MKVSTSKKGSNTKKTCTANAKPKAPRQPQKKIAPKTAAGAAMKGSQASHATTSRCTTVDDEEDEEPTHVGSTLDSDGDTVMEEVVRDTDVDAIEIDDESDEESEESELSGSAIGMHTNKPNEYGI